MRTLLEAAEIREMRDRAKQFHPTAGSNLVENFDRVCASHAEALLVIDQLRAWRATNENVVIARLTEELATAKAALKIKRRRRRKAAKA